MSLYILTSNIIDGDFSFPVEVEGSPLISTDEITQAKIITRKYAVLTSSYSPLVQGTVDPVFLDCYLINETPAGIQGPIFFFNRNYAQIPDTRIESRIVTFTEPGRTDIQLSHITPTTIGWNQYGRSAPYTSPHVAEVTYTYSLNPFAVVPDLTAILYDGAPVDFAGSVYTYVGNTTTMVDGLPVTEPTWEFVDDTVPSVSPSTWVVETNFRRWRGPIFETEVVEVTP